MKFSWLAFVKERSIPFITSGPHSAKGNVHIRCPWCGDTDHSEHMGLSLNVRQPYYACWRNAAHRGRNPARLIVALLGCTWNEANALVAREDTSAIDQYEAVVSRVLNPTFSVEPETQPLQMPQEFDRLAVAGPGRQPFLDYLQQRGFDETERLADYYNLRYCRFGHFAYRLIVPIYCEGQLVNWTGRDITDRAQLRYKNLSAEEAIARKQGYPPAPLPINSTVFNHDRAAEGGHTLVICEGPFDALKIDWFLSAKDCAVAVFGMPKQAQITILVRLAKKFSRTRVMLDAAAFSSSVRLWWHELEAVLGNTVSWRDLPQGIKDPGALRGNTVRKLLEQL